MADPCPVFAEPKLIPLEVLFGNPSKASALISPDASQVSYLAPVNKVLNIWVKTVGKDDDRPVTFDKNRGIHHYFWSKDGKKIFYLQDKGGDENWLLYAVDLRTGKVSSLTPFNKVQVQIVEYNKDFPDKMVVALNKDNPNAHDAYLLDLKTLKLTLKAKNPGDIARWVSDPALNILGAIVSRQDGGRDLLIRPDENSPWKKFRSWDFDDARNIDVVGFTRGAKYIYLIDSRLTNTSVLKKVDLETSKEEVLAEDSTYDIDSVLLDPETYEVQAVSFLEDKRVWQVIDKSIEQDFAEIGKLHRGDFAVAERDRADKIWIVAFSVDNGPAAYYYYDRVSKKGVFLFYNKPELEKYELARMEPILFKSRDGLDIHGYLTCPPGKAKLGLPLVLLVHGGPEARDRWGFSSVSQWLANRGYACLQVNYRGSTGYGKDFVNAGNMEWGRKMHDDLIDAVGWSVASGVADPKRVAIFGGSYGGYAALVGATFTPDFFKCAVDLCGPSNLITLLKSFPPQWTTERYAFYRMVGDPDRDAELLKSRSPLFKVANIKIPVLIAQGANDVRVSTLR